MQLTIASRKDFDVIDHVKLLAFFEVVRGGLWFAKKEDFYVAGVPVRIERSLLAFNVAQVTVIHGWNGSYGSMGPEVHVKTLDLVMRVLTDARWVQK